MPSSLHGLCRSNSNSHVFAANTLPTVLSPVCFYYYTCVTVCGHGGNGNSCQRVTWKLVLSFYHVGPRDWIQTWPALSAELYHWPQTILLLELTRFLVERKKCYFNKRCLIFLMLALSSRFSVLSVCVYLVTKKVRRGHWMSQNWSYRWLSVAMWVLETEPIKSSKGS